MKLRFVIRDGKKILQYERKTMKADGVEEIKLKPPHGIIGPSTFSGFMTAKWVETTEWVDVPLVEEADD